MYIIELNVFGDFLHGICKYTCPLLNLLINKSFRCEIVQFETGVSIFFFFFSFWIDFSVIAAKSFTVRERSVQQGLTVGMTFMLKTIHFGFFSCHQYICK